MMDLQNSRCEPKFAKTNVCRNNLTSALILIASFFLFYITMGTAQSFGVIYSELLDEFQIGKGETIWVSSLSNGLLLSLGPVAGYLELKYGPRAITMVGSIIIAVGMFCSGFVSSIFLLYLTYGIICGAGFGLTFLVANVVVPCHFHKRVSLATAFASAGGGMGTISTPLLTRLWLKEYGWRGSFVLMSGVALQGVICGAVLSTKNIDDQYEKTTIEEIQKAPSLKEKVKIILTCKKLWIFIVSTFIVMLGYFTIYVKLPDAAETKGLTKDQAAVLITSAGVSGLIGRVLVSLLADRREVNRCVLNGIALLLGGLSTIGCSFIHSYVLFLAYSIFLGLFLGTFAFLQGVIIVDIIGRQLLGLAFGLDTLVAGIAVLIGPPILGWIVDATGRYDEAFYCIGGFFVVGGLLSTLIPIYDRYTKTISIEFDETVSNQTETSHL